MARKDLQVLHDPYSSEHLAYGKRDLLPASNQRYYEVDDLLRYYFEHPSSTMKHDSYEVPRSNW